MHPIFFGDPEEPLYGVYHRPEAARARPVGVVLCQPALHEATHARRALRSLADQLARTGLHALRFDYHGTGDSAGSGETSDIDRWTADIGTAIDELKASRGLDDVGVIGLRFGASLATRLACRRDDIPFLVLWEPIVEGLPYLSGLRRLQAAWLDYESVERPDAKRHATPHEVLGHPLTPAVAGGIGTLDLLREIDSLRPRILLVDESTGDRLDVLGRQLVERGTMVNHIRQDGGQVWHRDFDGEQAQVPRALLDEIVAWVDRGTPP